MTIKQIMEKMEDLENDGKAFTALWNCLNETVKEMIDSECYFYAQAYQDVVEDYEQNILTV